VNGDDRIAAIMLTTEHFFDLGRLNLPAELIQRCPELVPNALALARPVDQHFEVVASLAQ